MPADVPFSSKPIFSVGPSTFQVNGSTHNGDAITLSDIQNFGEAELVLGTGNTLFGTATTFRIQAKVQENDGSGWSDISGSTTQFVNSTRSVSRVNYVPGMLTRTNTMRVVLTTDSGGNSGHVGATGLLRLYEARQEPA